MISIDLWTFIKDVFGFFARLFKKRSDREKIIDTLVSVDFGSGQPHLGKPEIRIMNDGRDITLVRVRFKVKLKRQKRFQRWHDFANAEWKTVGFRQPKTLIIDFHEVIQSLETLGLKEEIPTDENKPEFADLLYPVPIKLRVFVEFYIDDIPYRRVYRLEPICIFPENLTVKSNSTGELYWSFERIR